MRKTTLVLRVALRVVALWLLALVLELVVFYPLVNLFCPAGALVADGAPSAVVCPFLTAIGRIPW
jgi:hypothetical protein